MLAYIESIDLKSGSMVVEYVDPHELKNIRIGMNINLPIVHEDVIESIRQYAPITQFEDFKNKQSEMTNQANIDYVETYVGTTIEVDMLIGFNDTVY
jgi:hypothetical protein